MNARTPVLFRALVVLPGGVTVFAYLLHWAYSELVAPRFAYLGYRYAEPEFPIVVVGLLVAMAVAWTLPRTIDGASSVVLWLLYVITVAPTILMSSYTSYLDTGESVTLAFVVGAVFAGVCWGVRGKNPPLVRPSSPTIFWLVLFVFSVVTYGLLAIVQGLSLRFLSFFDVYDVRDEYAGNIGGVGILSYLVFTQANVVNPALFARGITERRALWIILALLGQLILYSGTGFKGMLFAIPAWVIVGWLLRRNRKSPADGLTILWGASVVVLGAAGLDKLTDSDLWTSLLSRRFLMTPGVFTSVYVSFFSDNPQVHLSHSILEPFFQYPYDRTPPYVIGKWMANAPNMAANANLFADGFANFGWIGIVGAGLVLLVYLRLLNRVSVGLPLSLIGVTMTMPTLALSNSSALTAMLSHGLVAACVLLALAPRPSPSANGELSAAGWAEGDHAGQRGEGPLPLDASSPRPEK